MERFLEFSVKIKINQKKQKTLKIGCLFRSMNHE